MSKIFYTSDLHFAHKNIVKFTDRGLATTQENHDEWLIDRWNSQVNKGDTVFHLGDFSFRWNQEEMLTLLTRLNGQKYMILGNHDDERVLKRLMQFSEAGVVAVKHYARHSVHENMLQKCKVELFHFPIASWRDQSQGSWHLHGHSHGNYDNTGKGKILDVGLDNSYKLYGVHRFFTEADITEYMSQRLICCADRHRKVENE